MDNEQNYNSLVNIFTSMPIDAMVLLDDVGIDFTEIDEWELFILFFTSLKEQDTSMILGDLDLSKFEVAYNDDNNQIVLVDTENDIKIDKLIHSEIANTLRKLHGLEKNLRKPANKEAREYLIEKERKKLRRRARRKQSSQMEDIIIALVNSEQFKYNFETVRDMSIYQFKKSVTQIVGKVYYDNLMIGVYTGNIDPKTVDQNDLNWIK